MKTKPLLLALCVLACFCIVAEETTYRSNSISISLPHLVRMADVASIGTFEEINRNDDTVVVRVSDFWAGETIGTNIITATHSMTNEPTFPTNVPVVFFAKMKTNGSTKYGENDFRSFGYKNADTNATISSPLYFPGGESAWFRTTRDNGLSTHSPRICGSVSASART